MTIAELGLRKRTQFDAVTWLSIYVVLLFLIPSKLVIGPLGSAGAPSMIFGLGSLLIWFLFRAGAPRNPVATYHPVRIALCAFLFSIGVSYAMAMAHPINTDEISPADVALLAVASWTGTLLTAHDGIVNRDRLNTLVWRIVLCGGVIAAIGLAQVATGQALVDMISIPGLTATEVAGIYTRGAFIRPFGTAIHPIEFGVVITMLLPLALHVAFFHTQRNFVVRWIPAALLIAIIPLTSSRSAYLGAVIAIGICLFSWPRARQIGILIVAALGVMLMTIVTPNLFNSIVNLFAGVQNDPSIASRTGSFDLAFDFVANNPLFGRGLGTFLPKYRIFDNQYLGLLVAIGIVGTLVFVALGVTAIIMLLRLRRTADDASTRDLSVSFVAAIAVGFVCLVMFDAFSFPMTMGALFIILGMSGALRRLEGEQESLLRTIR
ncbi:O-antigen ligase family protein [Microbacterium rhizomatis]|uniref:O-antigen ligase family protein n=1 Tax=Microbacterium rhizomatis TaxID=1631477 RepID=A0A5J5J014_9MICO|nr:O-antigen ligase family protein [Microbacterium rhizomatis]KAA9106484.1 O-antigen ligase family protein [Microbacterium rhizomatis]